MKTDYNKLMHEQIASFGFKPRLVLHCCCAPCSSAVIEKLKNYFDITFLFFNPNIYPKSEYEKRKQEFKKLGVKVAEIGYNHDEFLGLVKGKEREAEGGERCKLCIAFRLEKTFQFASENGFDMAGTTLSISPHKDAEFINQAGRNFENQFGVKFLFADFKKENGYLRSIQICKDLGIYRQNYCGCEFSLSNAKN